ncbi:hypothetical protein LIER_25262 [Lithospermum erythrorhizon]|uniref:Uncharacterized protein n=1 Tax=Lithospermum erythrorhizon TaxID=34254 RepID=A0AAV3R5J3_LITER
MEPPNMVMSARKLKIYFEAHTIKVITDQPLKRILANLALSGRLTICAIELSKFEISYEPRTSIKAQALADFIIEGTTRTLSEVSGLSQQHQEPLPEWMLYWSQEQQRIGGRIVDTLTKWDRDGICIAV